jgi:two-component system, cell cycle sensor histidine kinase and response regulator CckA
MGQAAKVLIVDDEPALLKMISAYLRRRGYDVTSSETTEDAWAQVESHPGEFAVAVLDATMAGLSMEELSVRMLGANSTLCIIATSGYPVDTSLLESVAPGRVAFLHKPFSPEMLADTVRRMLGAEEKV